MKKPIVWLCVFIGCCVIPVTVANAAKTNSVNRSRTVVAKGQNHRVWRDVTISTNAVGIVTATTNAYTELQPGLHYLHNGKWLETTETIDVVPGGAAIDTGPHKVHFSANINSAVGVTLTTPDGKTLESHILGLSFWDPTTGASVLIAELKDCVGEIRGDNQVVYPDAFTDFKADVRYTYTKSGFEQDIIFQQQPPSPADFGLSAATRLQVLTEFINPPVPNKVQNIEDNQMVDDYIDFGAMSIGLGRAFLAGEENESASVGVSKHWQQLEGRDFLIEEVKFTAIHEQLLTLPDREVAAVLPNSSNLVNQVSMKRLLPPRRTASLKKDEKMRVASASVRETGFVMDYAIVNTASGITFKSDTTYFVTNQVTLTGTNVVEAGTVIKFNTNSSAGLAFSLASGNAVTFKTSPYRPAVLTSRDDNSVGEILPTSTGSPTNSTTTNSWLKFFGTSSALDLKHIRVSYAPTAIWVDSRPAQSNVLSHLQITHSTVGITNRSSKLNLRNALFYDVGTVFEGSAYTNSVEHLTVDQFSKLSGTNVTGSLLMTNSVLVGSTNWGAASTVTSCVSNILSGAGLFQTVGAGAHYWLGATNTGTTNINLQLLSELRSMTVFPPTVISNDVLANTTWAQNVPRDTNSDFVSIGYHYVPLDYAVSGIGITNATLTITNGAAVGFYGSSGFKLQNSGNLVSEGSPTRMNRLVGYACVQEMANTNWYSPTFCSIADTNVDSTMPTLSLKFTDLAVMNSGRSHVLNNGQLGSFLMRDCQLLGGSITSTNGALTQIVGWTNNLLERVAVTVGENSLLTMKAYNNAFEGGSLDLRPANENSWDFRYNFFNGPTVTQNANSIANTNNAYFTNTIRIIPTNSADSTLVMTYQTGALGRFYQPTNSTLLNKGSQTADQVGLYHYTVTTNQTEELTSAVDIGFHYVAVDQSGNALDSDGDGLPDYLEDTNGNGNFEAGETSHTDYFNGVLPSLTIIGGNGQGVVPNNWLVEPLKVSTRQGTTPLLNAPITFSVSTNAAIIVSGSNSGSSVLVRSVLEGANAVAAASNFVSGNVLGGTYYVTATATSGTNSTNVTFTETISNKVFTPILSQTNGNFARSLTIYVTCPTPGAVMHYTMNGATPTELDPILSSGAFSLSNSVMLKVAGFTNGFISSDVAMGIFTRSASISAGYFHALVVDSQGSVSSWGFNTYGQLGDGSVINRSNRVAVTSTNTGWTGIAQAVAGNWHSLALKTNGTVWSWGYSGNGELGVSISPGPKNPIMVPSLSNIVAIAAGNSQSLALGSNGLVYACGGNYFGEMGDGNGGGPTHYTPTLVSNLSNVISVASGEYYSIALKGDGAVWTWGYGALGRLGNGTNLNQDLPVQVMNLPSAYAISAGQTHGLAACSNGLVYAWGDNLYGELGDGSNGSKYAPVQVIGVSNVIALSGGESFSLALDAVGRVWAWGQNNYGQLGRGYTSTKETNAMIVPGLENVVAISAGTAFALALQADGKLMVWGRHEYGQAARGEYDFRANIGTATVQTNLSAIAAGSFHNLALQGDVVLAWGQNDNGQVGNNAVFDQPTPVAVTNGVQAVSGGSSHSLALKTNGTLLAWGLNGNNQLGDGTTTQRNVPNPISNNISNVIMIAIAAGGNHNVTLDSSNHVWTWGLNSSGQLGFGNTTGQSKPVQNTNLLTATAISAGSSHTLALSNNCVWAWGNNANGRLGDGTVNNQTSPELVAGLTNIMAIAAGGAHSLFLDASNRVWACGYNNSGQLGDNTTSQRLTSVCVLSNVVQIASGNAHSVAIDANSNLWAWGENAYGQLGNGTVTDSHVPIQVLSNVVAVTAGQEHTVVRLADGSVRVFGHSQYGQLGDGNLGYHFSPVQAGASESFLLNFNDPPQIVAPYTSSVNEDVSLVFTNISISDVDACGSDLQLSLSVSHGSILLGNITGLTFVSSNSSAQVITANLSNLNAALSNLQYRGEADYHGADTLAILVNDLGHTGAGATNSTTWSVALTIDPINDAPTVTSISDTNILEDAGAQNIVLSGLDVGRNEAGQTITNITALSSNPGLIPNPSVAYTPGASTATLTFAPSTNAYGTNIVTVIIQDDGGTTNGGINVSTNTFTIVVIPVNDAPTLDPISDVSVYEDASLQTISLTGIIGGPTNEPDSIIGITIQASNTNLFTSLTANYTNGTTGTITFQPAANVIGTSIVSVVVQDNGGTNNAGIDATTNSFVITVLRVNDPPALAQITNLVILEDSAEQSVTLTGIGVGAIDETNQHLTVTAVAADTNLLSAIGVAYTDGAAGGTLTFSPLPNAYGTTVVSVIIQDDGGTSNGGVDIVTNSFIVTVVPVNDSPTLGTLTNITVNQNQFITLPLSGISFGPGNESGQMISVSAFSSDTNLLINPLVTFTNGNSTAILTFLSSSNVYGTATLSVVVSDAGGTNNGGTNAITNSCSVTVNSGPIVTLTAPTNGAVLTIPTNLIITATTSDPDGSVTNVAFYVNGNLIGNASNAPYVAALYNVSAGTYQLSTVASDKYGVATTSAVVNVTIALPLTNYIKLWLKADVGVETNGSGFVTNWLDQSGNFINVGQTNTNRQPSIVSSAINGKPVVRFSTTATNFLFSTNNSVGAGDPRFIFTVARSAATNGGTLMTFRRSTPDFLSLWWYDGANFVVYGDGVNGTNSALISNSRPVIANNFIGTLGSSGVGVDVSAWLNGTNKTVTQTPGFVASDNGVTNGVTIGAREESLNMGWKGDIAEILVYRTNMAAYDRVIIENYLNQRYGLFSAPASGPTNLTVTCVAAWYISLAWDNGGDTESFIKIERKAAGENYFSTITVLSPGVSNYINLSLSAGTSYTYRAVAVRSTGYSPYSNEAMATTASNSGSVPFSALRLWLFGDNGILVNASGITAWMDSSGNGNNATLSGTGTAPFISGINGHKTVSFAGGPPLVLPVNCFSSLNAAEVISVFRSSVMVPSGSHNCPMRLGGSGLLYPDINGAIQDDSFTTSGKIIGKVSFAVTNFSIYGSVSQSNEWTARRNGIVIYSTTNNTFSATGNPQIGQTANSGNRFQGDIAEILCFDRQLTVSERVAVETYLAYKYALAPTPSAPSNLAATALSTSQISLAWRYPLTNFLTTFKIERKTGTSGTFNEIGIATNSLAFLDRNVLAGTQYYYRIRASVAGVDSDYSNTNSTTTLNSGVDVPLNNLRLWLKADAGRSTGLLSFWQDQSGRENHATVPSSENAPFITDMVTNLNNRPVVSFYRSNAMSLPASLSNNLVEAELVAVLRSSTNAPVSYHNAIFGFGLAQGLYYPNQGGFISDGFGSTTATILPALPYALTNYNVYSAVSASNEWSASVNGLLYFTKTNNTVAFRSSPVIGWADNGGYYFGGDLAEVMMFDRRLTTLERAALEIYLNSKYGLGGTPRVPTNLNANAVSPGQINLTWAYSLTNFSTTFKIERKLGINGNFAEIAAIPNALAYLDSGLSPGTEYYYRVRASVGGIDSDYSNTNGATTLVTGSDVPLSALQLWLKADAGCGVGAVSYWLDQSGKGNHATVPANENAPLITEMVGALNNRPAVSFYRTNAMFLPNNCFTNLTEAELVAVLRSSTNQPVTYNNAIFGIGTSQGGFYPDNSGKISDGFASTSAKTLNLLPISLTNFQVYSVVSATNEWSASLNGLKKYSQTNNTVNFRSSPSIGWADNGGYYFGGDLAEVMVFSRRLSETEREAVGKYLIQRYSLISTPAKPSALSATPISSNEIALAWSGVLTNSKVTYFVERKTGGGAFGAVASLVNRLSFVDEGLTANTAYTYRIKAVNYAGSSDYSDETSCTTLTSGSPMPVSNVRLWLQGDAGHGDGFADVWEDQSGRSNNAVQATSTQWPVVTTNSCNGRPVISFYLSNRFDLPNFMKNAVAGEAFAVVRARTTNSAPRPLWKIGTALDTSLYPYTNGVIYDEFGVADVRDTGAPFQSITNYHVFGVLSQPDEWTARTNGVLLYSNPTNTVVFTSLPMVGGADYSDSVSLTHRYFDGDIAEILIFDKALSVEERQTVGRYLNAKYALMAAPATPTNLVGQLSSTYRAWLNQASLTWSNSGTIANFKVERSSDGASWAQVGFVEGSTAYSELVPVGSYYYRVKAVNYAGDSGYSDPVLLQVNQAPSFSLLTNSVVVLENAGSQSVSGFAYNISPGASYESSQALTFQVTNDYAGLFAVQPYLTTNGTLVFQPGTNSVGSAIVTVTLQDNGGVALGGKDTSAPQQFTITVQPVNHAPSFDLTTNQIAFNEDAGLLVLTNFVTNIVAGPSHEASQTVNFIVTASDTNFFTVQPSVTASGDLSFQTAPNVNGSNVVSVLLHDNGETNNGGVDISASQNFVVFVNPVNDRPTIGEITNRVVNGNAGTQTVLLTGISTGPTDENGQTITNFIAISSDAGLVTNLSVAFTNGSSTALLTFDPVSGTNGIATISVIAQDDGGTAGGGADTVTNTFSVLLNGINSAPTLTTLSNLTIADYDCPITVPFTGITAGTNNWGQTITVTAQSSDTNVISTANVSYTSPSTNGSLNLVCGGTAGTSTITVVVQDDGGTDDGGIDRITNTFTVTVVAVPSPFADDDYDGISNLQEVRDGTDPHDANSGQQLRLGYWKFNTANWLGEGGQVPLVFSNIQSVVSWSSNALSINTNLPALLKYREAESNATLANINCQNGTVSFWFKPDWNTVTTNGGTGPQNEATLLDLGSGTTDRWALVLNTNGSELSFVTASNSVVQTNAAISIEWTTNQWHQIVLAYNATNSTLYVDGSAVATNGAGVTLYPGAAIRSNGFTIGSDSSGTSQARGRFEELETFNSILTSTEIASNYSDLTSSGNDQDLDGLNDIVQDAFGIPAFYSPSGLGPNELQVFTPLK